LTRRDHIKLRALPSTFAASRCFPISARTSLPHVAVEPGWRVIGREAYEQDSTRIRDRRHPRIAAGTASAAGSCGAQVAELQQKIGLEQGANATVGATDPGVQQPSPTASADSSTSTTTSPTSDQVANTDNSANATIGATDPGVQQPAPEANAEANATTGTTTMPSGTVEETSRVGDLNTAAGDHAEAITALKKAQLAADAGDESTCMTELGTAKATLGIE